MWSALCLSGDNVYLACLPIPFLLLKWGKIGFKFYKSNITRQYSEKSNFTTFYSIWKRKNWNKRGNFFPLDVATDMTYFAQLQLLFLLGILVAFWCHPRCCCSQSSFLVILLMRRIVTWSKVLNFVTLGTVHMLHDEGDLVPFCLSLLLIHLRLGWKWASIIYLSCWPEWDTCTYYKWNCGCWIWLLYFCHSSSCHVRTINTTQREWEKKWHDFPRLHVIHLICTLYIVIHACMQCVSHEGSDLPPVRNQWKTLRITVCVKI